MVEAEQALESGRILLLVLESFDEAELLLDERLGATCEGLEHIADLQAQVRLLAGEAQCLPVHVVDGAGELTDLLGGVHRDPGELDVLDVVADLDAVDGLGQLLPRNLQRAVAQAADRADQRAGHEECEHEGREQGREHDRGVAKSGRAGFRGAVLNRGADLRRRLVDDRAVDVDTVEQRRADVEDRERTGTGRVDHVGTLLDAGSQFGDLLIGHRVGAGEQVEHRELGAGGGHQRGARLGRVGEELEHTEHLTEQIALRVPGVDQLVAVDEDLAVVDLVENRFDDAVQAVTDLVGDSTDLFDRNRPGLQFRVERLRGGSSTAQVGGDRRIELGVLRDGGDGAEGVAERGHLLGRHRPGGGTRGGGRERRRELDDVRHGRDLIGRGREVDGVAELVLDTKTTEDHCHGHGDSENGGDLPAKTPPSMFHHRCWGGDLSLMDYSSPSTPSAPGDEHQSALHSDERVFDRVQSNETFRVRAPYRDIQRIRKSESFPHPVLPRPPLRQPHVQMADWSVLTSNEEG